MAQYKGIKEILKKFWNASKIWIKNNFTTKKFRKLKFHSIVAENGHTVINMGNDAVNIYIHKDGCYTKFDKMPTEGSIQKITDVFKVELFPDTCVIDTFDVSVDVSWNTISDVDGDDDNVIEILRNHINSIGNPHDTSVDNVIGLSAVGRTGDYKDILNKPTIPTENTVEEWGFTKFSGSYNDLSNKPTIPEAQVQTDWEATEGIGVILNKPTLGTAAAKNYTSSISNNSTDLPTSEAVYSYINSLGIENIIAQIGNIDTNIDNIEQQLSNIFSAESKVTDFNTTTNSGIYYWVDNSANRPGTDYGVLLVNKYNKYDSGSGSTWINQVAYGTNNKIYFRQNINSGNWTEWKAVAFEGEGKARFLDEYSSTRLTSGNIVPKDASEWGGMRKDVVTSSMTDSGRPGKDGHLLTMFWDNSGRYDSQFFVSNDNPPTVKARAKANVADYGPWVDIITSNNIGSQTVAKASTAGNADTAGTADKVASAGTSGMWIQGRANAICKTTAAGESGGWKTLASIKTRYGSIEIGNLANEDYIRILYSSDANVNAGNNYVSHIMKLFSDAVSFDKPIYANAGIKIPTSQPSNTENGDIWIQ